MSLKKILCTFSYLLIPSSLIFSLCFMDSSSLLVWMFVAMIYLVTIIGLGLYFKYKLSNIWVLLSGVAFSPVLPFIYEYKQNSEFFTFLVTTLSAVYYALPFALISIIVQIIINAKNKEGGKQNDRHHLRPLFRQQPAGRKH